ncbi:MAG: polyprenol monophosphomannose synthase [Armatimonadetes bacterium]|nr:polyprenol monophosphomannose synthase [Armatimonadota bacterium]
MTEASGSVTLSLVVPTYNEREGLEELVATFHAILSSAGIAYELVIVDDNSPDGTGTLADELAGRYPLQVIHRTGKQGLASAVIQGWAAARGSVLGVTDADLSHDPHILPAMVASVERGGADVAVGSRYIPGGGMGHWPLRRQIISRVAVALGQLVCPARDVTSGYLVFRRDVIQGVDLDPIGFKIGLEVLVRGRYRTFTEIPYVFRDRQRGRSKLNLLEIRNYLVQLGRLLWFWLGHRQPRRRVSPSGAPVLS